MHKKSQKNTHSWSVPGNLQTGDLKERRRSDSMEKIIVKGIVSLKAKTVQTEPFELAILKIVFNCAIENPPFWKPIYARNLKFYRDD